MGEFTYPPPGMDPQVAKRINLTRMVSACMAVEDIYAALAWTFIYLTEGENSLYGSELNRAIAAGECPEIQIIALRSSSEDPEPG